MPTEPIAEARGAGERRLAWAAAAAMFVAGLAFVADGPEPGDSMWLAASLALLGESLLVVLWLAAAAGFGMALARLIFGRARPAAPLQLALGVAAMIALAWALGTAGWLNTWSAWALNGTGWALWVFMLKGRFTPPGPLPWTAALAAPALALLAGAAVIAPGVLWKLHWKPSGEHLAYDVLSYHLQLPREWMQLGAIAGLQHNVYSYLPSGLEAAFCHVGWMRGGLVEAGLACQLLHAALAVLAAVTIATLVRQTLAAVAARRAAPHDAPPASRRRFDNPARDRDGRGPAPPHAASPSGVASYAGAAAGAAYLATPWVIATGSIAYNEQAMVALGAAGLAIALSPRDLAPGSRGLAAGLLCGAASLCKLTAVGMFALPVALVLLWRGGLKPLPRLVALVGFALAAALVIAPYALRNLVETGNPLFPMATGLFGTGHWTLEQAARWQAAHMPHADWPERLGRFVDAVLAAKWFGYLVFPLAAAGLALALARRATRRIAALLLIVVATQIAFWLAVTHLQSRFAIPLLAPACIALGLGLGAAAGFNPARRLPAARRWLVLAAAAPLVGWLTFLSYDAYAAQANGLASRFADGIDRIARIPQWGAINDLPPGSRVYAEGYAIPLYVRRPIDYHTVWDRSRLGRWIEQHGVAGGLGKLREAGFTHLLVEQAMLERWMSEGNYGYDPTITRRRLELIESAGLPVAARVPGVLTLYRLQRQPAPR